MDKQVKNLAGQLRREGISPERDLWPGIQEAIDQAKPGKRPRRPFDANAWYRLAAVAATLILLVGSGYFGAVPSGPSLENQVAMTENSEDGPTLIKDSDPSLLQRLNHTISDLDAAMALDPDNIKLTRLSLMTHKSRANLLRVGTRR